MRAERIEKINFIPVLVTYDGEDIPVIPRNQHDDVDERVYVQRLGDEVLKLVDSFVEGQGFVPDVILRRYNALTIECVIPTRETREIRSGSNWRNL